MTEGKNTKNVDIYMVQNTGGWWNEKDVMKYSMSILYYLYQEVGHQVQFTLGGKSLWGLLRDV